MDNLNGKRAWYAIELAQMYEEAAHDAACYEIDCEHVDMDIVEILEYERLEWLAEIWDDIAYCLHGKWYS